MLTFEQIQELIELVAKHRLEGVSIERSGFKIEIVGRDATPQVAPPPPAVVPVAAPAVAPVAAAAPPAESAPEEAEAESSGSALPEGSEVVSSPIVGTFYAAPNPDSEPYARVGDRVEKGQVLCIVEAMKLMNEIESEVSGVVVEVFPKNGQPVEYGEPLFAIQPG